MIQLPDNSLYAVVAFALAVVAVLALAPLARRVGLVDRPDDDLKDHERDTPIVGGLAVFVAFQGGLALSGEFDLWLLGVTLFLLVVGVFDDVKGLPPLIRLGAAVVGGVLMAYAVGADADILAAGLVVVLLVVAVNAVNLLDGADAVAGSAALVTAIGLVFMFMLRDVDAVPPLILAGALGGFLILNWPPARVFLGDGGAYVVAAALTYLVATSTTGPVGVEGDWLPAVLVATCLFGVFYVDLAVTLLRRMVSRQPLFGGDRSHVYDQLADRGWAPLQVASSVASAQVGVIGLVLLMDLALSPWAAVAGSIFLLHTMVTLLCAMGFAYRPAPRVKPSAIFQDPEAESTSS